MRKTTSIAVLLIALAPAAWAGESMFNRAYTTDTVPQDRWQVEQDVRLRTGRITGVYNAWDLRTALQHGLADDLQLSINVGVLSLDADKAPDDYQGTYVPVLSRQSTDLESFSVEFLKRLASPEKDAFGLAFAVEPTLLFRDFHNGNRLSGSYALRTRAIVQKDWFEDRLVAVFNTAVILTSARTDGVSESRRSEVNWNNELAAVMRVASNLFFGAEARNYNDFPDQHRPQNATYSVGPVAHYGARRFWATLGALYQVHGWPNGGGTGYDKGLYLRGSERWEFNLKLAVPL